jgi:hypothetical protein
MYLALPLASVHFIFHHFEFPWPPNPFLDDDDYQDFLDILAEIHRLWGIEVFRH